MIRMITLASATVFALVALTSCSEAAPAEHSSAVRTRQLDASWSVLYTNPTDLAMHSDLAVSARAVSDRSYTATAGYPMTNTVFTIDQIIAQRATGFKAGDDITVNQTGGRTDGTLTVVRDDPLYVLGERDVLFLQKVPEGYYQTTGGPSGRFSVSSTGYVQPFGALGAQFSGTLSQLQGDVAKSFVGSRKN